MASLLVAGCATVDGDATSTSVTVPSTTATVSTTTTAPTAQPTTTSAATSTSTTMPEPSFTFSIEDVDLDRLAHSYRADCPVQVDDLVLVEVAHRGFDGEAHDGAIVVARSEGESVAAIFERLFEIGYPIDSMIPIGDLAEGIEDDDPDYNNTSGLHCRLATGSNRWSEHARGLAIDINPLLNPFVTPNTLWPGNSERYLDRSLGEPGMITDGDAVVEAFSEHGWLWGGYWESIKDYHHFSVTGR